ncbi:MAG TPA: L,D-transpeptidase, partial [Beijerinckiaceae bacterium]|nr:L,D-transpeptidase [Beijerinckiaceae bacterium]
MRRLKTAILGFALAAVFAPVALAYEIDPLTREPILPYQDTRVKATPIPREEISYSSKYAPGTIIVNTIERRLYYILGDGRAIRY